MTWYNNHNTRLPIEFASAWMFHGRDIGVHNKWAATIAISCPEFEVQVSKLVYGVQDDFGNFVKVDHDYI